MKRQKFLPFTLFYCLYIENLIFIKISIFSSLQTMFVSLTKHLIMEIDLFSLSDLQSVYNKNMATLLEPIVYYGKCHVETCQVHISLELFLS